MMPWLVDPAGVGALLDGDELRHDLQHVVAGRDVLVAELLDEELAVAAGRATGTGLPRESSLGPDGWATSLAVARRHLEAFAMATADGLLAPELVLAGELLDPHRSRVVVRVEGDVDRQVLVVRDDTTVLHDHVDGEDDRHVVVLRSLDRARGALVGLVAGDPDDPPRRVTVELDDAVRRRVVAERRPTGPVLLVDDRPPVPADRRTVVRLVADLLV